MAKKKRILIATTVKQREKTFQLYLKSLRNLKIPDNVEVGKFFILHNSQHLSKYITGSNESYYIENDRFGEYDNEKHNWTDSILLKVAELKNRIIEYSLCHDYDYIFFVDSDLVLQPETLESLYTADKNIIAEVFWTKWSKEQMEMPNAWCQDQYTYHNYGDILQMYVPGIYRIGMVGACTLIKKKVLEKVNFDIISNVSFSIWEDRAFCIRAAVHGFGIYLDTQYPAKHLYREEDLNEVKS